MTGFFLTLLAVLLAGFGARDQATIEGLALRQGARPGVLLTGIVVSVATAGFAAWAAGAVAPLLAARTGRILAAMALAIAGVEALAGVARRKPEEPTASLGALAIVLFVQQLTDAARFLVFAVAVATNAPTPAGMAGAVGGAALLAGAWIAPAAFAHGRARLARRVIGAALLLAGGSVALWSFGLI